MAPLLPAGAGPRAGGAGRPPARPSPSWGAAAAAPAPGHAALGYACAAGAAFIWSSYSLLTKRLALTGRDFPTAAIGTFGLVSGVLALVCHALLEPRVALSARDLLLIAVLGLGPLGGAFFLWDKALKLATCAPDRRAELPDAAVHPAAAVDHRPAAELERGAGGADPGRGGGGDAGALNTTISIANHAAIIGVATANQIQILRSAMSNTLIQQLLRKLYRACYNAWAALVLAAPPRRQRW